MALFVVIDALCLLHVLTVFLSNDFLIWQHVRVLTNRQRTGSFMGHLPKELVTLEAEKAHRLR